jgi:hypothetical protein
MNDLTLSKISERIASGKDNIELAKNRIWHWTNHNLIPTEGDSSSGRGRHRQYSTRGLLIAAILWELSRFDLPVGVLKQIKPTLDNLMDFVLENIEPEITSEILKGRYLMWFVITCDDETDKYDCIYTDKEKVLKQKMEDAIAIILNIEKIAKRVTRP